jgi:dTDP-4-amino-4,6-dideoxygalactose transaminase
MPIMLEDAERRGAFRGFLREERGVQTSVFYPAIHEFTAYRERYGEQSLPRSERAARTEVTIPLFPHMTEGDLDQVVTAIEDGLAR